MLGEQFEYEDEICGAVVSVRKVFYRVALWIKSSEKNEKIETIGSVLVLFVDSKLIFILFRRQLKKFLNLGDSLVVEFTPHGDSAAKSSENRFTI
jgi:translation initiation factor 4E